MINVEMMVEVVLILMFGSFLSICIDNSLIVIDLPIKMNFDLSLPIYSRRNFVD